MINTMSAAAVAVWLGTGTYLPNSLRISGCFCMRLTLKALALLVSWLASQPAAG